MKILVINGPNLNMLGIREPQIYGSETYLDLVNLLNRYAEEKKIELEIYQSNHEGDIIDKIQAAYQKKDGLIINAGGYTHTSIAIMDAVKSVNIPSVEVHISDLKKREDFRQISYLSYVCEKTITGKGLNGYLEAIDYLMTK